MAADVVMAAPFASDSEVVERVLTHVRNSTTDLGDEWFEPVENYLDPDRFRAEVDALRRLPTVFAPAAAVADTGDYLARDSFGVPLFVTRGRKVLVEQTLEGYHIRSAHRTTFYPVQYDNLNVIESAGMHSRVTYPYRNIERVGADPATSVRRHHRSEIS